MTHPLDEALAEVDRLMRNAQSMRDIMVRGGMRVGSFVVAEADAVVEKWKRIKLAIASAAIASAALESKKDGCILVWAWREAPERYRVLSTNGGDEDWVAFVPCSDDAREVDVRPSWAYEGSQFGRCSVDAHRVNGGFIFIGAHA